MQSYLEKSDPKTILMLLATVILFLAAYFPVIEILVGVWLESEEYAHAFLVVPIIIYIIWNRRDRFQKLPIRYSWLGLALLIFCTFFYPLALLFQLRTLIALSMCLTLAGIVLYLNGLDTLIELTTPLILLLMLIPVPDQIFLKLSFPLQLIVSQITEVLIQLFDIPILREGNIISIPGKSLEVVQACSGLRSMIALLTLSVIMGYFFLDSLYLKVMLFLASIPTAIFVNIIRLATVILFFHFYHLDLAEGYLHHLTGIIIFLTALLTLFALLQVLKFWETKSP
jgi:exosortase